MDPNYRLKVGDVVDSPLNQYQVREILGSGVFGDVTLCRKVSTDQMVALKMLKHPRHIEMGHREKEILQFITEKGSASFHIVQWFDSFDFKGRYCHEFEKLDISLMHYLRATKQLPLKQIRPLLIQMAGALMFLKSVGVMHCDLKPDNVMMIDHVSQPLRIKIIDFGVAVPTAQPWPLGSLVQALWYRSPEVFVGSQLTEAIDMWALGLIAAEMFLGKTLFPARDETDMMRHIHSTVGQPSVKMLETGVFAKTYYFHLKQMDQWLFKPASQEPLRRVVKSLDDLLTIHPNTGNNPSVSRDHLLFVDMIKKMLDVDQETRLKPEELLCHPFLTMSHLLGWDPYYYTDSYNVLSRVFGIPPLVVVVRPVVSYIRVVPVQPVPLAIVQDPAFPVGVGVNVENQDGQIQERVVNEPTQAPISSSKRQREEDVNHYDERKEVDEAVMNLLALRTPNSSDPPAIPPVKRRKLCHDNSVDQKSSKKESTKRLLDHIDSSPARRTSVSGYQTEVLLSGTSDGAFVSKKRQREDTDNPPTKRRKFGDSAYNTLVIVIKTPEVDISTTRLSEKRPREEEEESSSLSKRRRPSADPD